jgi:Fe-S cluster assembly protein SufD
MPTVTATGFQPAAFEGFLAARSEPDWLTELRRRAFEVAQQLPLPDASLEEWRRTDIRMLRLERFSPPGAEPPDASGAEHPVLSRPLLAEGVAFGGRMATLNGACVRSELAPRWAQRGVLFGSLEQLAAEYPQCVRPHLLTRAVDYRYDKFAALHAAFWTGGALLYVPRNVVLDEPLHIVSALTGGSDFGHTLIVLEEGAEATVLAETAGGGDQALHCGAVEILVGPRARLRYVNLQHWDHTVWHFAHHKALVEQDAQIQWTIAALGSRLAKVNQHVALLGPGAQAQVNGVLFTEGRQHLSYHTLQHHEAPHCTSDLLYKAALQDQSRIVWRGMIKVDPGAQRTDGYQRNDNLMLSDHARADSIPGLEIEADDVRCTHGATTAHVDSEQVFYCRSRGLTRKEAARMIVAGFFQQVFDRITIASVREALSQAIGRRVREYQES